MKTLANEVARRLFFILLLGCVGCSRHDAKKEIHFSFADGSRSPFETTLVDQLTALTAADPRLDARTAYGKKDFRLVGVLGIGVTTPGVKVEPPSAIPGRQRDLGLKIITGTSDFVDGTAGREMVSRAVEYAKIYNVEMAILLTNGGEPSSGRR